MEHSTDTLGAQNWTSKKIMRINILSSAFEILMNSTLYDD
jgi:hypothetical protein